MRGKHKNKKIKEISSIKSVQDSIFDNFVKYFICFIPIPVWLYAFFLCIKDSGFRGIISGLGLFSIIFLLINLIIWAIIFFDNRNKQNISKIYGIILYTFLAITTTVICSTQPFIETYYCENNICKVTSSTFFKDKPLKNLTITPQTESIGMNIFLEGGSMTSTGIVLDIVKNIAYYHDVNNVKTLREADSSFVKLKSLHGLCSSMILILSCVFIIPVLYILYSWEKRIYYFILFMILGRLVYIFFIL